MLVVAAIDGVLDVWTGDDSSSEEQADTARAASARTSTRRFISKSNQTGLSYVSLLCTWTSDTFLQMMRRDRTDTTVLQSDAAAITREIAKRILSHKEWSFSALDESGVADGLHPGQTTS